MLDNEDVNLSESSTEEATEPTSGAAEPDASSQPESKPEAKSEDNVPFHMHPRFQEVIAEKNALKEQFQAQQKLLADLQHQMKAATPAEKDELMERLEGIDPKFAAMLKNMREELKSSKQALEELSGWRQQSSAQSVQQQISTAKTQFYTENKVPDDRRAIYEAMVQSEASKNPSLQVSDLPKVLKQVHETLGKMFQNVERSTTKQFVESKKGDAAKPAPMKPGAPAKAVKQNTAPVSRQELLEEMRKAAKASLSADKDI